MAEFRAPAATYRLQLNAQFGFAAAREIVGYLHELGITDLYLSPIFKARPGSIHGYDVTEPTQFNPELGTEAEFENLVKELHERNMGLLLDIVPNHMAISPDNPFWMDVLEKGRESRYAGFFDIDWEPCGGPVGEKVLLPVLGKPFGKALEDGEISLVLEDSRIFVRYFETRLPVKAESYVTILSSLAAGKVDSPAGTMPAPLKEILREVSGQPDRRSGGETATDYGRRAEQGERIKDLISISTGARELIQSRLKVLNGEKGDPHSFDGLERILNEQSYRLAYWRTGSRELNYRRFFDINTLIGVRVERPEVMDATHAMIYRLVEEGKASGLRIDHIDGLYDPLGYLERLQRKTGRIYIIAEKILSGDETLPGDWPVQGTTGYDFAREVNNIFIDSQGMKRLEKHYAETLGEKKSFSQVVYEKKKQVITDLFYGEARALGCRLLDLARGDRYARDLTERDITQALIEMTACLEVYRTYIREAEVSPTDRKRLIRALEQARQREPALEETALEFLRRVFLLEFPEDASQELRLQWLNVVMEWQQFTGPATAKGLEDTALYNYNRLTSLNVIGASLEQDMWDLERFHIFNRDRQMHWPLTLNATSTHDTKRSEDVSARINVISEMSRQWTVHLSWWKRWSYTRLKKADGEQVPDANTTELLYQTLAGAWPLTGDPAFKERFKGYMLKAAKEARAYTSWTRPDEKYEKALADFIDDLLEETGANDFREDFRHFQRGIAFYGALNSLSQTLLKITSPGAPDFYQGTELWDLSLVDPDNRRPVDYRLRAELLAELKEREKTGPAGLLEDILDHWTDGRVKLYLTYKALDFRRKHQGLYQTGEYLPLSAEGKRSKNLAAFARHYQDEWAITAVQRLFTRLVQPVDFPLGSKTWGRDWLLLPEGSPVIWLNMLTGERVEAVRDRLPLARVFETFPAALLVGAG
jgi:(1->4)-alpha-D-glucan 1-alpha-D-glucosylmutase